MEAGGGTCWHYDGTEDVYAVRLHIPIITNNQCFFATRNESYHLPADGSAYVLRVNVEHCAHNFGSEDRYHLVMNMWDVNGVTRFNRYTPISKA